MAKNKGTKSVISKLDKKREHGGHLRKGAGHPHMAHVQNVQASHPKDC